MSEDARISFNHFSLFILLIFYIKITPPDNLSGGGVLMPGDACRSNQRNGEARESVAFFADMRQFRFG